jgi:3-deoxy-manno-octulosonate cytidylyltransferase (CMP-KDO synthetase)
VIDALIDEMEANSDVLLATPMWRPQGEYYARLIERKNAGSTSGTFVVFDQRKNALYFSKGLLPFARSGRQQEVERFLHIGIYAYRSKTLETLAGLSPTRLEKIEKLEQLRALENSIPIRMVDVDLRGRTLASVDTPEDVPIAEKVIAEEGELF